MVPSYAYGSFRSILKYILNVVFWTFSISRKLQMFREAGQINVSEILSLSFY